MGIVQCINNLIGRNEVEPTPSRRVSNFDEEDLTLVRLNYMKNVLLEKRNESQKQSIHNFQLALKNKKDKSLSKIYLQKKKICDSTTKNIDGKIMLIDKQTSLIQNAQEDRDFINTIKNSNNLLKQLKNEVDTNALTEALYMVKEGENDQKDILDIMEKFGIQQNEIELEKEFEKLQNNRQEDFDNNFQNLIQNDSRKEKEILLA